MPGSIQSYKAQFKKKKGGGGSSIILYLLFSVFVEEKCDGKEVYKECISKNYKRKDCDYNNGLIKSAKILKEVSNRKCYVKKTWGYTATSVWVDKGCGAKFLLCAKGMNLRILTLNPFEHTLVFNNPVKGMFLKPFGKKERKNGNKIFIYSSSKMIPNFLKIKCTCLRKKRI